MKRRKISFGESSGLMLTAFLIVMGLNVIGSILLSVISVVFAGNDMLWSITQYVLMLLFQAAYIGSYLSFKKVVRCALYTKYATKSLFGSLRIRNYCHRDFFRLYRSGVRVGIIAGEIPRRIE